MACRIPEFKSEELQRGRAMLLDAVEQALQMAALTPSEDTGVFVGSTIGESAAFEKAADDSQLDLEDYSCFSFGQSIQKRYDLHGLCRALRHGLHRRQLRHRLRGKDVAERTRKGGDCRRGRSLFQDRYGGIFPLPGHDQQGHLPTL